MGLGTFDAFLGKLGELQSSAAESGPAPASTADVIIEVARRLAQHQRQMPLADLLSETSLSKSQVLTAVLEGTKAGVFDTNVIINEKPGLGLTPLGETFL